MKQKDSIRLSKYTSRKTTTDEPDRRSTRTRNFDNAKNGINTIKNIANGLASFIFRVARRFLFP